ncbi:DUF1566 domain-containing protein [Methylomonas sp. UP202]|uniref:DUF1566 domain-containing protein n=1 Tax=Methylomonas sp. UP202 TaxID=3040943 RepID=UPI0024785431|nr:DUF1566 domain-containing protein [Methylomonas sp. UP202]WGS88372.1 DUF1566 domain-containing protein [Methylomonas sp. UP202]
MLLKQPLLAASLLMSAASFNANASVTDTIDTSDWVPICACFTAYAPNVETVEIQNSVSYIGAGNVGLLYSGGGNITWTRGNLFETLYDANHDLVSQIASVTPSYYDPSMGWKTIDAGDFDTSAGTMTWWGANAFVGYLNSINYGGSSQWRLPSAGSNPQNGSNPTDSEFLQLYYSLYYSDLGRNHFDLTFRWSKYWTGTEYAPDPNSAWTFDRYVASQYNNDKSNMFYAWVVSPGQVAAVPIPGAVWLFGSGLVGLLSLKRRGHVR